MVKIVISSKAASSESKAGDTGGGDATAVNGGDVGGLSGAACISSYILPPVGLPNLGNTCFMNSGIQVVWRAFLDHFLISITLAAKLPKTTTATASSSSALPSTTSTCQLMNARIAALREHLTTLATTQGVPLGAIIAKAVLKHIKHLQGGARGPMEGGSGDAENDGGGGGGDIEGGPPGLMSILGELFLRDAATSMSGTATSSAGKKSKKSSGSSARVSAIKDVLASENERFVDWDQHDSHELVMCLLSAVSSRFNTGSGVTSTSYEAIDERKKGEGEEEAARRWWRKVCAKDDSFVGKMFRCLTRTKTVCGKCGKVSLNFDPIMEVQVSLSEASIEKANARKQERISASMGMSTNGTKPTALHKMTEHLEILRGGDASTNIAIASTATINTDDAEKGDEATAEGGGGSDGGAPDDASKDDDEAGEEEEVVTTTTTSTLSKKDQRALKKAEKARVKHERDLKKLKRDTIKPSGKGKAKKGASNVPNKKGGGGSSSAGRGDDDNDDDLVCLEDLLYTQLTSSTEVEGFKCEGCGAVSASSPASPPPTRGYPGTTSSSKKKGGGKQPASKKSKRGTADADADDDNEGAAAASSSAAAGSTGTTTVITHDHTHYPPFMLVHLLRFDYGGDKIRVPVKLSTASDHVLDITTSTIRPSTSALLALPPRPSTSQLDDRQYNATKAESSDEGSDDVDDEDEGDGVAKRVHGALGGLQSLYEVVGVVRHHGRTLTYGHYTSSVKGIDFFDRPIPTSQVNISNQDDVSNEPSQWYLCDDTSIDGEKVGRAGSSVCWKGGDRDAYMVLLRSVKYAERTSTSSTNQDDEEQEAPSDDAEGNVEECGRSSSHEVAKTLPSSHL